jgi:hypothetical protein
MDDAGIGRAGPPTGALLQALLVLDSLAIYNALELSLIIWTTFKRHSGCYFWSFIVATYGIPVHATGLILKSTTTTTTTGPDGTTTTLVSSYVYVTLMVVGWIAMVTGQSMVLWSRLHLIVRSRLKLRLVLYMIITDAVLVHTPTGVLTYGANASSGSTPETNMWLTPYSIMEKVQVTIFFLQELIISSLYIFETLKLMRFESTLDHFQQQHHLQRAGTDSSSRRRSRSRGSRTDRPRMLMTHLICVNVVVIILDISILGLEYAGQYQLQIAWKVMVYSVKLKLEFTILNKLVEMTGRRGDSYPLHVSCPAAAAESDPRGSRYGSGCDGMKQLPSSSRRSTAVRVPSPAAVSGQEYGGIFDGRASAGDVAYEVRAEGGSDEMQRVITSQHKELVRQRSIEGRVDGVMKTTEIDVHHEERIEHVANESDESPSTTEWWKS